MAVVGSDGSGIKIDGFAVMSWFRRIILCAFLSLVVAGSVFAQSQSDYLSPHSFGIRLGNEISVDYKFAFTKHHGLNAKLGVVNAFTKGYQFAIVSLAYHYCIGIGSDRFYPYFGGGASTGMQFGEKNVKENSDISYFLSADIPLGFEYRLKRRPVVFCLEWSPKAQFLNERKFVWQSVDVGVRYVFPKYR